MALIIGGAAVRYIAKNSSWLDAHSIGEMIIKEKKRGGGRGEKTTATRKISKLLQS